MVPGDVGRAEVPARHAGNMRRLLEGIPLETMNTSLIINATDINATAADAKRR